MPIATGGWGGSGNVVATAITNYFAYKLYPDIMTKDDVIKGANYIFGCHPYSNLSFVNAVGTKSKKLLMEIIEPILRQLPAELCPELCC